MYAPHNDISINDGPHTRRWSHKIIILYYIILYYIILYYIILYYIILYYSILYHITPHHILYYIILYYIRWSIVWLPPPQGQSGDSITRILNRSYI